MVQQPAGPLATITSAVVRWGEVRWGTEGLRVTGYGKILFTNFLSSGWTQNRTTFSIQIMKNNSLSSNTTFWVLLLHDILSKKYLDIFTKHPPSLRIKTDRHSSDWCWCAQCFSHNSSYVRHNLRVFVFQVCNITRLATLLHCAQHRIYFTLKIFHRKWIISQFYKFWEDLRQFDFFAQSRSVPACLLCDLNLTHHTRNLQGGRKISSLKILK